MSELKNILTKLTLPFPPSLNMMYPSNRQGRRFLSDRGVKFKSSVHTLLKQLKPTLWKAELTVEIKLFRPKKVGDADNYIKPIFDALKGYCFEDDKQINEIHVYRFDDKDNPRAEVILRF